MMTRLDFFRDRISLQTLIILLALLVAPAYGIGIVAATRGEIFYLLAVGAPFGVLLTLFAPVEFFLLTGVLFAMLADSRLIGGSLIYYGRFVPMGMLTLRTILDIATHRVGVVASSPALLWSGLLLTAYAGFSTLYSPNQSLTIQRGLSMFLVVVGFGLGLPNYLNSTERLDRALKLVILLIAGFVLVGVVSGTTGDQADIYVDQSFIRVQGLFLNPNTQGLMAMLSFFPIVWWWQTQRSRQGKIILGGMVLLWGGIVLATGSRASVLGLIVGGTVLALLLGRVILRYVPFLIVGVLLLGALLVAKPEFTRAFEITSTDNGPVAPGQTRNVDRPYLLQRAIELGMRSPIYGVGFGASDQVFQDDIKYLVTQGVFIAGAHNSYARMFVELGVFGVVLGVVVFGVVLFPVVISPLSFRHDWTLALLTATVVAGMTNAFFEDWLYGFGNASTFPMWFFVALIPIRLAQLQRETKQNDDAAAIQMEQNPSSDLAL